MKYQDGVYRELPSGLLWTPRIKDTKSSAKAEDEDPQLGRPFPGVSSLSDFNLVPCLKLVI